MGDKTSPRRHGVDVMMIILDDAFRKEKRNGDDVFRKKTRQGKARQEKRRQDKTRQHNTNTVLMFCPTSHKDNTRRQDKIFCPRRATKTKYEDKTRFSIQARQDKTRQDKARQDKTRQDKTRQEQDKTRQDTNPNPHFNLKPHPSFHSP
jgi:hypothetical protein